MELVSEQAVTMFRDVLGPTDAKEAKQTAPQTLRAAFGSDAMRNAVHGSATEADFQNEAGIFFGK